MTNPPKFLIFDLDGTLIDSVPDLTTALNLLRRELDLDDLSSAQVTSMVGDGAGMLVKRALGMELFAQQHLDRFLVLYGLHLLDQTRPYPGIIELLEQHDPACMAIVTNKPIHFTERILEGLGLREHFAVVIGGDSFPHKKPHPYPVQQALIRLEADPSQAIMIGDHHTDLYAGRGAGTAVCFCSYGFGHCDNLTPDCYAHHPGELLKLFPGATID